MTLLCLNLGESKLCFRFGRMVPVISTPHSAIQMHFKQPEISMPLNSLHSTCHKIIFS